MTLQHYGSTAPAVTRCARPYLATRPHAHARRTSHGAGEVRSLAEGVRGGRHAHTLPNTLLRGAGGRTRASPLPATPSRPAGDGQLRRYATAQDAKPREIAVVGGGITGLASAYFLSQTFPKLNVTLFESKERAGGWMRSSVVDVGSGEILFDQGPRSLRPQLPNGTLALRLIQELGLAEEILMTDVRAPAARNRYVYYPDHLVRLPGPGAGLWDNLRTVLFEPAFERLFSGMVNDARTDPRGPDVQDESVGAFISRRFDRRLAENLASAMFHGIYGGDVWNLSAKSTLALQWAREPKYGDVLSGLYDSAFQKRNWSFCDDIEYQQLLQTTDWHPRIRNDIATCSVFTLRRGLGQLVAAMEERLRASANVRVLPSTSITAIEQDKTSALQVTYAPTKSTDPSDEASSPPAEPETSTFSHIVSTIPPNALIPLLRTTKQHTGALQRSIGATQAVTISVVNLYFDRPDLLATAQPPGGMPRVEGGLRGFGYLIPASVPFAQNPERALGVLFDSDITPDLWSTVPPARRGTRVTVMLGGHWWDGWSAYPTPQEAEGMALAVLARHLGITDAPRAVMATLQRDCIAQYAVGHSQRMSDGHDALMGAFDGRVRVAGSWYGGVGVNDCLRGAFEAVLGLASDLPGERAAEQGLAAAIGAGRARKDNVVARGERTGLEKFRHGRPMALIRRVVAGEAAVLEVERAGLEMGYFKPPIGTPVKGEDR